MQCYRCSRVFERRRTVILETPKGRFRLCMDCYNTYANEKLKEEHETASKNIKLYGLDGISADELTDQKQKFIKRLKGGLIGKS